jgi:hypothetical protein
MAPLTTDRRQSGTARLLGSGTSGERDYLDFFLESKN